jgi:type I restriction-modification system DNA methylase subunit
MAKKTSSPSTATIGFEATLWQAADKLRNNMDAGEYKHVVLGLIFLKYISDSFEEMYGSLLAYKSNIATQSVARGMVISQIVDVAHGNHRWRTVTE